MEVDNSLYWNMAITNKISSFRNTKLFFLIGKRASFFETRNVPNEHEVCVCVRV